MKKSLNKEMRTRSESQKYDKQIEVVKICGKQICTTAHVLSAWKTALTQGRYTFRHDSVLRELLDESG